MKDQDQFSDRDHWRAIAEQLGLSPEDEPSAETTRQPSGADQLERKNRSKHEDDHIGFPPGSEALEAPEPGLASFTSGYTVGVAAAPSQA